MPEVSGRDALLQTLALGGFVTAGIFLPEAALTTYLANAGTANGLAIAAGEMASGNALGGGTLAVGTAAIGTAALKSRDIVETAAKAEIAKGTTFLLTKLTGPELRSYASNAGLRAALLGKAVERATRDALQAAFPGRFRLFSRGPDFLDRQTGDLIELTTGGQALTKGVKYGPSYGLPDLENVAIYNLFF